MPYVALPDHKLDQSPCRPIITVNDEWFTVGCILK